MPHVKINVIEHTEDWLVMEGTSNSTYVAIRGRYNCKSEVLKVWYQGSYKLVSHIIEKMEQYVKMKGYPLERTDYG